MTVPFVNPFQNASSGKIAVWQQLKHPAKQDISANPLTISAQREIRFHHIGISGDSSFVSQFIGRPTRPAGKHFEALVCSELQRYVDREHSIYEIAEQAKVVSGDILLVRSGLLDSSNGILKSAAKHWTVRAICEIHRHTLSKFAAHDPNFKLLNRKALVLSPAGLSSNAIRMTIEGEALNRSLVRIPGIGPIAIAESKITDLVNQTHSLLSQVQGELENNFSVLMEAYRRCYKRQF